MNGSHAKEGEDAPPYGGAQLLRDPVFNKGAAFSPEERDHLRLRGLMPPSPLTIARQATSVLSQR